MATFKVVLDLRRKKQDGTYPIIIRVSQNRKSTSVGTGICLAQNDWDKNKHVVRKSHPNAQLLNNFILQKQAEVQREYLLTSGGIESFTRSRKLRREPDQLIPTFFEYGFSWVERLKKSGKVGNARAYENTLKRLTSYLGHSNLLFSDINFDFLEDFQASFLSRGIKQNSISFYLRTIRTIFNKAIKAKVVDRQMYPFEDFAICHESTAKRAVGKDVICRIETLDFPQDSALWHSKNYFLLSFYLIGISFVDLSYLRWSDIKDGRVTYKRRKTGKIYNINLLPKAMEILAHYQTLKTLTPFILPIIPVKALGDAALELYHTRQGSKYCNINLKKIAILGGISENLSTYVARHSWATIARTLGFSVDLIAAALGHEHGNKVTQVYLDHYDNKVIDAMNSKVIE